ncbi:uncharacterized protein LOC115272469 [Suricata suricatta]|uniref:uncharacterized protein LOC115272469 n=1 Tax=Suricata suricatta TaxID=37032 RepID=UPI0011568601|nr:uncharacterized protein LOC115272469 [Suricata suricatta]
MHHAEALTQVTKVEQASGDTKTSCGQRRHFLSGCPGAFWKLRTRGVSLLLSPYRCLLLLECSLTERLRGSAARPGACWCRGIPQVAEKLVESSYWKRKTTLSHLILTSTLPVEEEALGVQGPEPENDGASKNHLLRYLVPQPGRYPGETQRMPSLESGIYISFLQRISTCYIPSAQKQRMARGYQNSFLIDFIGPILKRRH